jgi:oxepin-CoA hydrolase/3-oxo-5,6-dehydrosuberyl-CoA semialdehyde dehydrogenase
MKPQSYAQGEWHTGSGKSMPLFNAVTGDAIGEVISGGLDYQGMLHYARTVGGAALRKMTFHDRARLLKKLALYLMEQKDQFYKISAFTGATKADSWIDIEGGIGVLFTYASRGRRDFPNETAYVDGALENLSKTGSFVGLHVCTPMLGAALHINAFNFPVWGMLEKIAANLIAGVPAIVKPATVTCYLAEAVFKSMIESKIFPEGSLQLISGSAGDIFDHLGCEDIVTFTGSAETGKKLKSHPGIVNNSIRFNMEADSLNCSILGSDVTPDSEEFEIFIKEVAREMTVKAGQKCTAIRRTIVPASLVEPVTAALKKRLSQVKIGDPQAEGVRMGPLAGLDQLKEVRAKISEIQSGAQILLGAEIDFEVIGADRNKGAFISPTLLYCDKPFSKLQPHNIEAFGPVNTILPYATVDEAIELAQMGKGSLVGSLVTGDDTIAKKVALGVAPYHGRLVILNKECTKESTGHGSPLPQLVHGGPGRAGGGEEMGGARAVMHYMQRTALQGSPTTLGKVCNEWLKGGVELREKIHPFRKHFEELQIGETLITEKRIITEEDILKFAALSGDHFYAHMEDSISKESIFGQRVAHGYFIVSAAAGLFVDPAPGPVLANYGLEGLRFTKPVFVNDSICVRLTCKKKTAKDPREGEIPQGVVEWDVEVKNQNDEVVAVYSILTLVKRLVH